jgi:hypothetical protein
MVALETEKAQHKEVLAHPQFKINPTATIKDHIKNMLAVRL